MDLIRKIPKKFTKKFGNKVINRQYFRRKTGLKTTDGVLDHLFLDSMNMTVSSEIFPPLCSFGWMNLNCNMHPRA